MPTGRGNVIPDLLVFRMITYHHKSFNHSRRYKEVQNNYYLVPDIDNFKSFTNLSQMQDQYGGKAVRDLPAYESVSYQS